MNEFELTRVARLLSPDENYRPSVNELALAKASMLLGTQVVGKLELSPTISSGSATVSTKICTVPATGFYLAMIYIEAVIAAGAAVDIVSCEIGFTNVNEATRMPFEGPGATNVDQIVVDGANQIASLVRVIRAIKDTDVNFNYTVGTYSGNPFVLNMLGAIMRL